MMLAEMLRDEMTQAKNGQAKNVAAESLGLFSLRGRLPMTG
ncbi:hypothetical protein [Novipirellula sp.]